MKRILFSLVVFALCFGIKVNAQEQKTPDWKRWHYLSEEEMNTPVRNLNFVETDPPAGEPRFVAEFEPMQGVMIRYPLGIPTSLVAQMSNNCHVYCIVSASQQSSAQSTFQSAGVNMSNLTFVNASSDSYWVRYWQLDMSDIEAIKQKIKGVDMVSPIYQTYPVANNDLSDNLYMLLWFRLEI